MEDKTTYAVTFGRMNLPHPGHVHLVKKMLEVADQAIVCLSAASRNTSFETRAELLRLLCEREGLPSDRIQIRSASSPYDAVESVTTSPLVGLVDLVRMLNTTVVLGVDQTKLGERLRDDLGVTFVPNEVRIGSSTVIRYFIEIGDEQVVREIYHNDDRMFDMVLKLRREELHRDEKS